MPESIANLLGTLLLLLTAFPYLQLMPSDSYTQPFALLLGAMLFFMKGWSVMFRLPLNDQIALIGLAIVGIGFFLVTCFPYENRQEYKYLTSYLSPLLLTIPLLSYVRHNPGKALRLLRFSILSWIVIAAIQKFLDPTFMGFLIGQWGENALDIVNSGRGVLGLAPEPTHHAYHILLLATCLALLDRSDRSRWILMLSIIDAILLAASSSAILVLGISGLLWSLWWRQGWFFFAMVLAVLCWQGGFVDHVLTNSNTRVAKLLVDVLENPSDALVIDYSMNQRLGGMFAVIWDAFRNLLIPHGMSVQAWETARSGLLSDFPWLMDLSMVGPPSGIGLLLFQTGLLSAIFVCLILRRILTSSTSQIGRILVMAAPIIFFGQYYVSAPTFSLLYACSLFVLNKRPLKIK